MELSPQKARILLMLALMNTTDSAKLQQIVMQY
jgi:L-asparaginase/Glu-tRNA(Gln) amidotransferase subunit D